MVSFVLLAGEEGKVKAIDCLERGRREKTRILVGEEGLDIDFWNWGTAYSHVNQKVPIYGNHESSVSGIPWLSSFHFPISTKIGYQFAGLRYPWHRSAQARRFSKGMIMVSWASWLGCAFDRHSSRRIRKQ